MKKTIAQELGIKHFPFEIRDSKENLIYTEWQDGYWTKRQYCSEGYLVYFENSDNFWEKRIHDSEGFLVYYENSSGLVEDYRPKE